MRSILNALQDGRLFELPDAGKPRSLTFLARILDANPNIEVGTDAIEEIQRREQECNTGVGLGVAVPHARASRDEGELFCAIGWSAPGIAYGSADGQPVHLVFMYYIPCAQKNVYLKEVSVLVKAVRKSGGMTAIAQAPDLNTVRHLLLDWVSLVASDSGPEAVARMIKLDLKPAQSGVIAPVPQSAPLVVPSASGLPRSPAPASSFSVLIATPGGPFVLSADAIWTATLEKENNLSPRLVSGEPFTVGGRQVFVTRTTHYSGQRTLYECVAIG